MKRTIFGLVASIAVAGSLVAAQDAQPAARPEPSPEQQQSIPSAAPSAQSSAQKAADVTLTGCLVQGSSPTVFVLQNAKAATDPATSTGKSYVLDVAAGSVDFKTHLNNQVRIVGAAPAAGAASSMGQAAAQAGQAAGQVASEAGRPGQAAGQAASQAASRMNDRDLPKFSARTISKVSDTCSAS